MALLGIREAAEILGYTEKGLRKIVDRSRAKAHGGAYAWSHHQIFPDNQSAPQFVSVRSGLMSSSRNTQLTPNRNQRHTIGTGRRDPCQKSKPNS